MWRCCLDDVIMKSLLLLSSIQTATCIFSHSKKHSWTFIIFLTESIKTLHKLCLRFSAWINSFHTTLPQSKTRTTKLRFIPLSEAMHKIRLQVLQITFGRSCSRLRRLSTAVDLKFYSNIFHKTINTRYQ